MPWAEKNRCGSCLTGSPRLITPGEPPGPLYKVGAISWQTWDATPVSRCPGFIVLRHRWGTFCFFHEILNFCLSPMAQVRAKGAESRANAAELQDRGKFLELLFFFFFSSMQRDCNNGFRQEKRKSSFYLPFPSSRISVFRSHNSCSL